MEDNVDLLGFVSSLSCLPWFSLQMKLTWQGKNSVKWKACSLVGGLPSQLWSGSPWISASCSSTLLFKELFQGDKELLTWAALFSPPIQLVLLEQCQQQILHFEGHTLRPDRDQPLQHWEDLGIYPSLHHTLFSSHKSGSSLWQQLHQLLH